jgi:DNA-binding NtrC family response regulator
MFVEILQNPNVVAQNQNLLSQLKELRPQEFMQPVTQTVLPKVPTPVLVHPNDIHEHVEVEESLNIMDKERELIIKALKKHKGKRKDAALDLGISERTLYRKLKEYDIEE